GEHGVDARHRHRLGDVDPEDARMRVRAAYGVAPEHARRDEVARVRELALDLRHPVGATDEVADAPDLEGPRQRRRCDAPHVHPLPGWGVPPATRGDRRAPAHRAQAVLCTDSVTFPHEPSRAARRTASKIFSYPVQRQRLPESASRISSSDGSGERSSRSAAATTRPGVQNPHCTAPVSTTARCTGCGSSSAASPSTVVTSCPSACAASTRQEQTSTPSSNTEHEPHSPCSHAFFEPGYPSFSRSAKSSDSPSQQSASAST